MSETGQTSRFEGRCSCGSVRFALKSRPMFVHCCHCKQCQRLTGSAFALNALIEADRVEVLAGAPVMTEGPTESGRPHDIYRCPSCHTALWSDYGRRGNLSFVRVGTLEDPSALPPDVHIYTRSRLAWIGLPENVPTFDAYYDMKTLWPEDSLKRRYALSNAR
jgi:hypothetical protein